MKCGAKCRTGKECQTPGMANGRCRMHGGGAGRKPKTGRYGIYLKIFGQKFSQLASDPELMKADSELALLDVFMTEHAGIISNREQFEREGGDYKQAWMELMAAAKIRADIAAKADTVIARREQNVTDQQMMVLFTRWMDITANVAGADAARRIGEQFQREALLGLQPGHSGKVSAPN